MKITYILSNIDKAIAFEWIYAELKERYDFSFIFIGKEKGFLYQWLRENDVPTYFIPYYGKKSLPLAFYKTIKHLIQLKPKIIHTHLFEANLIGLSVGKLLGISKRIYTRHHSTFHHDFYPKAVKWDKYCNFMATDIVAITNTVKSVLVEKEKVNCNKIVLIEHGFKLESFDQLNIEKVTQMKMKYHLPRNKLVIGVISRYIKWKGLIYIIRAFKKVFEGSENIHLVLSNAFGPDSELIQNELSTLPKNSFTEIIFENDLFTLYGMFDIFIHCPIDDKIEAFGQTYVEALAASVPSIFTKSGIANDFIEGGRNALVVEPENESQIASSIKALLSNKELREKLVANGLEDIQRFSLGKMIEKLEMLYTS